MSQKKLIVLTLIVLMVLSAGIAGGLLLYDRLGDLGDLKEMAAKELEDLTGHKVQIGSAELDFNKGISIRLQDLTIGDSYTSEPKVNIESAWVVIKLLPLWDRRIEAQKVIVQGLHVRIVRDSKGRLSIGDLQQLQENPLQNNLFQFFKVALVQHLVVRGASVEFLDLYQTEKPIRLAMKDINLTVRKRFLETLFMFKMSGMISNPGAAPTAVEVSGRFDAPFNTTDLSKFSLNGQVKAHSLRVSGFYPYLKKWIPSIPENTLVSIDSKFSGSLSDQLVASGEFQYATEQHGKVPVIRDPAVPHHGVLQYKMVFGGDALEIEEVVMTSGPFRFQGRGRLGDLSSKDPSVSFHLETDEFLVEKSHSYLPLMVFSKEVHRKFQSRYGHGSMALRSIDFAGKLTQLHNLADEENFKLLSTEIFLNKVDWLDPLPPLKKVTGLITTRSGDSTIVIHHAVYEGLPLSNIHGKIQNLLYRPVADLAVENRVDLRQLQDTLIKAIDDEDVTDFLKSYEDIDGTGLVRFSLKGPMNDPEQLLLTGTLDMEEVTLFDKDMSQRIENLQGKVEYRRPVWNEETKKKPWIWIVRYDGFSGEFGNSSFHGLNGEFGMRNGLGVKNSSAVYRLDSRDLKAVMPSGEYEDLVDSLFQSWQVSGGTVEVDYHSQSLPAKPERDRVWGNIKLLKMSMKSKDKFMPILNLTGDIEFGDEKYRLQQVAGWYGDSPFQLSGTVNAATVSQPKFSLSLTSSDLQQSDLKSLPFLEKLDFNGPIRLAANLEGSLDSFTFRNHTDLTRTEYNIGKFMVKPKGFENQLDLLGDYSDKKGLTFKKLVYSIAGNKITGSGDIKNFKDPKFSLRLAAKKFKTYPVAQIFQPLQFNQGGIADFELQITGNLKELSQAEYRGSMDLKSLVLKPDGYPNSFTISGNVRMTEGKFHFQDGELESDLTKIKFSGLYKQADKPTLDLKVTGDTLVLDEMFPESGKNESSFSAFVDRYPLISDGASRISIELDRLDCKFLTLKKVSASMFFAKKNFKLTEMKIGEKNPILVKGVLSMTEPESADLKGRIQVKNIRAERLTGLFGDLFQHGLTGTMKNLDIRFKSQGLDRAELVKSMQAKAELDLYNGEMNTGRLKQGALQLFGLRDQGTKHSGAKPKGFTIYKQVSGDLSLDKGILQIENFIYEDESSRTSVVGKFDLERNEMDTIVGVAPMAALDKFLTKIPLVGKIITGGDEASLLKTYYTAKGKFDDPEITLIPFTSLTKKVMGIFQGILQTPHDILIPQKEKEDPPTN